jgi:hypothetical protein
VIYQFLKLVTLNSQKLGHFNEGSYLFVVVSIVEELIKSIACLLSLGNEEKMVFQELAIRLADNFDREVSDKFNVIVVDDDIVEVHDEEIENFLVLEIVTAHFVKSVLGAKDIVDQI